MATKKKLDWPQVVMVLGIGALAVYALGHVDSEKLAAIPAETWALIASALAGVVGTVFSASRGRAVRAAAPRPEPKPATPDLSDEPLNEPTPSGAFRTGADARERETDPGAGFVSVRLLIAIPAAAAILAIALSGCGGAPTVARQTMLAVTEAVSVADVAFEPLYTAAAGEALEASATLADYHERVRLWDVAADSFTVAWGTLRAADAALDAWDAGGSERWLPLVGCLALVLVHLATALEAVHFDVPPDLRTALALAATFGPAVCASPGGA